MLRRLTLIIFLACLLSTTFLIAPDTCEINAGFFVSQASAWEIPNPFELDEDKFCKGKLFGTMSYETCSKMCKPNKDYCVVAQTHKASDNKKLTEDLDCYGH